MTELELGWLAGILEGEGSFFFSATAYPRFDIQMSDRDVIERVAKLVGSNVRLARPARGHYKLVWGTSLSGTKIIPILTAILPHMGQRRVEQINKTLYPSAELVKERRAIHAERARKRRARLKLG